MELFLPSLFVFLLATIIIVFLLPKLSPILVLSVATLFLAFGIYHHFKLFRNEYAQSTWQDQLKLFAPGIMLTIIIVYVLFSILMFFTKGEVPVPSIPSVELPPANTATNVVTSAINNVLQTVTPNTMKTNTNNTNRRNNEPNTNTNKNRNETANNTGNENKNKGNENLTRSFLATI
jgi:hypothetical protein